ncbi:phosphotransferase enzyme family protein [Rubritalea spongiae]|uniref:Phosphotransferase enzyme family protein n=1 Tax=Rubritalea spongiae TaxID=430797 RepID=A0ABW5E9L2_9BACT
MRTRTSLMPPVEETVRSIGQEFIIDGEFIGGSEIEAGHINVTYVARYLQMDGSERRYILQCINGYVFKDPVAVVRNVERVTQHIAAKLEGSGEQYLKMYPARRGGHFYEDAKGRVWRCYNFIEGCRSYDVVESTEQAYEAASAFGRFQDLVSDLDVASLVETIPSFHHTPMRFARLMDRAADDPIERLAGVVEEVQFLKDRKELGAELVSMMKGGLLPVRVTHNDTKLNNVMMDERSGQAVCVIDLDTVMPGLAAYDFGDLVRTATSAAAEDEQDLSKVEMRMPMFEALARGYIKACPSLTAAEIHSLVTGCKVITLEVAIRFLTDYLEGDLYFKTEREGQNLDRVRVQITLLKQMEEREAEMEEIVRRFADSESCELTSN